MTINIEPVEIDGQHWINVIIGGTAMERRGPFASADEAEVVATRLAAWCRAMNAEVHMPAAAPKGQQQRR